MIYSISHADCGYGKTRILHDISLKVESGQTFSLLGPNGVGKTTLFKSALGLIPLMAGSITLDGEDVTRWGPRQRARLIGYVPQVHTPPFPFSVIDVVTMGRVAHLGSMASPGDHDVELAEAAMERLGIMYLRDKTYTEISGGERQMVLVARALAQEPRLLVMDEPTANLDFGNQVRVLEQVNRLAAEGMAVIMTTHFPDHAFLCEGKVGLLSRNGFVIGEPDEVVTEESLRQVYGVDVRIISRMTTDAGLLKSCVPIVRSGAQIERDEGAIERVAGQAV